MNPLDKLMVQLNKQYKQDIIQKGTHRAYVEKIPFSSPRTNYMTYGGIPVGKATEFFGPEGGGKTTGALDIVGQAQKKAKRAWDKQVQELEDELTVLEEKNNKSDKDKIKKLTAQYDELLEVGPKRAVYVDAENTLDEEWAQKNGVDTDALYLIKPENQSAEQVLQMMIDFIDTGMVEIIVLDSVPMLVSQQLLEETLEKKSYAGIAGALTEFSRKVSSRISKHHTALLMINQVREDIDNPYNQFLTPGGKALKHLFALRIFFQKGSFLDEKNQEIPTSKAQTPFGNKSNMKIIKTKVCKPDRLVGYQTINYMVGVDVLNDTIEMALQYKHIALTGSWYSFIDPQTGEVMMSDDGKALKFQGRPAVIAHLKKDKQLFKELYEAINAKSVVVTSGFAEDEVDYEDSEATEKEGKDPLWD